MDIAWLFVSLLLILCLALLWWNRKLGRDNIALQNAIRQAREQAAQSSSQVELERRMRQTLIETLVDPVFFLDADRNITYCNTAAWHLTHGTAQPGRSLMEAMRSYELDKYVEDTLDGRSDLQHEINVEERLYRVHTGILNSSAAPGAVQGAVLILRDVSDLQRLGRARRDFVANISHELRTPLTTIRLLIDTLRMDGNLDATQNSRHLDQISTQVDALTQLAQEMYDLSQIESGQMPMRMVKTPLHDLIESVMMRLTPQAERAGTILTNEITADVTALVDPEQISRVISNLLHNAIKFAPGGRVNVFMATKTASPAITEDAGATAEYLTVAVRDTGVGIARTDLPRIFERFYKANRPRGQRGTGLGLAIAKHIVEAHGGSIWVESVEGHGATFYFTVPREG